MLEIRRDECAILSLVLKGKWYDMIDHGGKREEYRLPTEYWRVRLDNWDRRTTANRSPVVEFRRGYRPDAPRMAFWCMGLATATGMKPYAYVDLPTDKHHHLEWGEPEMPHFFIELGGRVTLVLRPDPAPPVAADSCGIEFNSDHRHSVCVSSDVRPCGR